MSTPQVSGAILSNTLSSQLSGLPFISKDTISGLTSSTYGLDKLGLTASERDLVLAVYMRGLHYIFIFYAACVGSAFVMCAGVGNTSLKAKNNNTPTPAEEISQAGSESDASVGEGEKREGEEKTVEV